MERPAQLGFCTIMSICILLQMFLIISTVSARTTFDADKLSLLKFKAEIDDDPLGLMSSWNGSVHFCSWPGVSCGRRHQHRVTRLDLRSWRLKGSLSPHVGNLSFLRFLNLQNNSFGPEIPPEIGRLFRLRDLNLRANSFSGKIPTNISGCSSLRYLGMADNHLTGRIPKDIGLLSELRMLQVLRNRLVGEILASIGNLSSLLYLDLGDNILQGNIPDSLSQLKSLKVLAIGNNNLTGSIPMSIYNLSTLDYFSVQNNRLEGSLPPNLGNMLPNLQSFYVDRNNFYGSIPATLSNASNLVFVQIAFNNFTGKVPSFTSYTLRALVVGNNSLGYSSNRDLDFLHDLFNSTNLEFLALYNNKFGGKIPETLSNVTTLSRLTMGGNQITGNIPNGIGNLVSLKVLAMEQNQLTGSIPDTIGKLSKMHLLSLHANKLTGEIPSTLRNLTFLSKLTLEMNNIQGSIPPSLGDCKNLQLLILAGNNLSGAIPVQLVSSPSLSITLNLSGNRLSGPIPFEVGKLESLGSLDISENMLSGEIPKTLSSCISLEILHLQGNFLEGSIPEELKSLRGLEEMDLSGNKLSGKIPEYFGDFGALEYLNLSFNDFEGQVPQQGVFQNLSKFFVMGNKRLCGGMPELELRPCAFNHVEKKHAESHKIEVVVIVACTILALIVLLFLGIRYIFKEKRSKDNLEQLVIFFPRASYGDLFKATNGFSSTNLIGVGGFGSVYKGTLNQEDTLVAVKVLNLQISCAIKSFIAECEFLKIVKHRNLVRIVTVCSSIDFQGNDFKALVYEFMENGNLEEWLHSCSSMCRVEHNHGLTLIQRLNVAVDVASALDYLHNYCSEPIAHCDIKPSNILFDGDMVAHIGDFGLAKLLRSYFSSPISQTSSTIVRGTVGYVAPECGMGGELSTSGDIYSFGILLLEMFTGKRPTDSMFKDDFNLHNFASAALPKRISEVLDPMLLAEVHQISANEIRSESCERDEMLPKSLVSIFEIGVASSSAFPGERRSIGDVAAELRHIRDNTFRASPMHLHFGVEYEVAAPMEMQN